MKTMLATTDETFEVRALLVQAVAEGKVFLSSGPPRSAKTETVRDTFAYLGTPSIVVSASPDASLVTTSKFWEHLCSDALAAWPACPLIVDEIHRWPEEALRVAVDVASSRGVPLCLMSRTGVTGSKECPQEVLQSCLECRFQVPDSAAVMRKHLCSIGFISNDTLSQKWAACNEAFLKRLSKQPQYDFGMRIMRRILPRAATELASGEDETACLVRAIWAECSSRLAKEDLEEFRSIIMEHFESIDDIPDDLPELTDLVESQLQHRSGSMIVHGEMARIDLLCNRLQSAAVSQRIEVERVPVVMVQATPSAFFGELARSARRAVAVEKSWVLVVVGCEGSTPLMEYFEPLNSMFDENRRLCLPNGEVLRLHAGVSVILLLPHSAVGCLSPATVSRLGCVVADDIDEVNDPNIL